MIQIPAILSGIGYTADGGLSLRFGTNELSTDDKVTCSEYHRKFGYLLFKENEFQDSDVPKDDADGGPKSKSKRLRDVLFVYWKQQGCKGDFDLFYRTKMENLIDIVKGKLV